MAPKGVVSIKTDKNEYNYDGIVSINTNLKATNNLLKKIYFDSYCGYPTKLHYRLPSDNEWKIYMYPYGKCSDGSNDPDSLLPGQSGSISDNSFNVGINKIEFIYYLNKEDHKNKLNPQSVYSNEFIVNSVQVTKSSIIESCKKNDEYNNGIGECLYLSAKNIAQKDLNLALDLCKEMENIKHPFSNSCYNGVALILSQAGLIEEARTACNSRKTAIDIKYCIDEYVEKIDTANTKPF